MPRYFIKLAYQGSQFSGWQTQPNADTIQDRIEAGLHKILRENISIVGCGRTDAGVHASKYFIHLDLLDDIDIAQVIFKLNKILPNTIALQKAIEVEPEAHARFDATLRSYTYRIHFEKDPFLHGKSYKYNFSDRPHLKLLQEASQVLLDYQDFYPFCKSNSDVDHYKCDIKAVKWEAIPNGLEFNISANRFLRGMIRLIVGMCINVSLKKYDIQTVRTALEKQERLKLSWSVPPEGLYLSDIQYSFINPNF